jgi:hypothetical protein
VRPDSGMTHFGLLGQLEHHEFGRVTSSNAGAGRVGIAVDG